jgi:hypothetical protein
MGRMQEGRAMAQEAGITHQNTVLPIIAMKVTGAKPKNQ